jgi:SPP1 family predicted phage head-tail adaptor
MLSAGKLNSRVRIEQRESGRDGIGQPLTGWVEHATVWANIAAVSGLETVKSNAEVSVARYSIRIRCRPSVTAAMRVVYGSNIYAIRTVLHDVAGREYTDLVCDIGASKG